VRKLIFVILSLLPPVVIGGLIWHGRQPPPVEHAPAVAKSPAQAAEAKLRTLLEPAPTGTKITEKVTFYDEKTLFDYNDGAAPIFLDRHFLRLGTAEYSTPEGSAMPCAIFDMVAPENAQSIFDKEKSSQAKPVDGWPEAISGPLYLGFHHGRYYAKLTAFDAKGDALLPAVARALKERMQ
jgi:hypothetical protein